MTKKKTSNRSVGRQSRFSVDMIRQAELLAIKGFTDKEIAEMFGVAKSTINNWKHQHPHFSDTLKRGKEIADQMVVRALYDRATGYSHPDVHICQHQGVVIKTLVIKHYPPDVTACIYWLKNRIPHEWRDKIESDVRYGSLADIYAAMQGRKHGRTY